MLGIDIDAEDRHRHAEIEAIGQTVGAVHHDGVSREPQRQRSFNDVTFECRVEASAIARCHPARRRPAAIDVFDMEDHFALPQILAFERVIGRSLIADAEAAAIAPDGQSAFREERAEALAAAAEGSERRIELVGEAAGRRPERKRRQLRDELLIELLRRLQLIDAGPEVRFVARIVHGHSSRRQDDRVPEQPR